MPLGGQASAAREVGGLVSRHPSPPLIRLQSPARVTSLCCSVAACDSGHWGPDCSYTCNCSVGHGGCDAVSGLCMCEAGYVGLRCEQRESRPGPLMHVHMHAHMHTHTRSCAHTRTSVRGTQPCFLSTDKQGVSSSKPTPTSPSGPPLSATLPLPGLKRRPTRSKGSERWGQSHTRGHLPPVGGEESVC